MSKNYKLNEAMNPAYSFINTQDKTTQFKSKQDTNTQIEILEDKGTIKVIRIPEGMSLKDAFKENKTKRVQLVMQPSKFNQMKEHCQQNNISVNDFINTLIENYFHKQKE